jgi:F-box protein GID2
MHQVFRHLDAQSLAVAACVCRVWRQEAMNDNVWELVCTKHWPDTGDSIKRLGSVVNAMGGFRHLYTNYLRPILSGKGRRGCNPNSYSSRPAPASNNRNSETNMVWGEDQVQLSLSLFSVEYYRRLGFCKSSYAHLSSPSSLFTLPIQSRRP